MWFMGPQLMWRADIYYIMRWLMHKMKHDIRKRSLPNATKNYKSLYHAGRRLLNVLVLLHFSTNGTIFLLPYWSELSNINYNGWDHIITEWLMLKLDPLKIENDTYYLIDTSWCNTVGGKLQSMRHVSKSFVVSLKQLDGCGYFWLYKKLNIHQTSRVMLTFLTMHV